MRYTVRKSIVELIGGIWMPYGATCAQRKELDSHDLANIGEPTRENVEQWLMLHSGDFSSVTDFSASLEIGDKTVDIPWSSEESEMTYNDCMFPCED